MTEVLPDRTTTSAEDDQRIPALIDAANQALREGRVDQATRLVRQAEQEAPRHPLVLNELGRRMLVTGNLRRARELFEQAAQGDAAMQDWWGAHWSGRPLVPRDLTAEPLWPTIADVLEAPGLVLEAGCGYGQWVQFLGRRGHRVVSSAQLKNDEGANRDEQHNHRCNDHARFTIDGFSNAHLNAGTSR